MDDRMKEKMKLSKKLAELVKENLESEQAPEEFGDIVAQYIRMLSEDVAVAIGGVSDITASFILVVLNNYVKAIAKDNPEAAYLAEVISERMQVKDIKMVFPMSAIKDEDDGTEGEV